VLLSVEAARFNVTIKPVLCIGLHDLHMDIIIFWMLGVGGGVPWSGGYWPASTHGGPDSNSGRSTWNLWCPKLLWDRIVVLNDLTVITVVMGTTQTAWNLTARSPFKRLWIIV
jgi:hypothetical protein